MAIVWWVLTYLDVWRPPHAFGILAKTNLKTHLWMKWSKTKPARRRVWKRVRGVNVWCGYKYWWDTPNLLEQLEPGETIEHLFATTPLAPTDHVWYYLFAPRELYLTECQTALFHIPPPELPMPTAQVFRSVDQPCANSVPTLLLFDSVLYNDYNLFDIAQPDRFTIPAGALYAFGANISLSTAASGKCHLTILINAGVGVVRHDHLIEDTGWAGATLTVNKQLALRPGDFLQVQILYTGVGLRAIKAYPQFAPYFWIAQIGAYPVSPP